MQKITRCSFYLEKKEKALDKYNRLIKVYSLDNPEVVDAQKELAEAFNKSIEVKGVSVKNGNKAKNKKRDINKDDKKSQDVK